MRKIESQMISAIYHAKAWKNSNTHTEIEGNTVRVFLHGNLIATLASKAGLLSSVKSLDTLRPILYLRYMANKATTSTPKGKCSSPTPPTSS